MKTIRKSTAETDAAIVAYLRERLEENQRHPRTHISGLCLVVSTEISDAPFHAKTRHRLTEDDTYDHFAAGKTLDEAIAKLRRGIPTPENIIADTIERGKKLLAEGKAMKAVLGAPVKKGGAR